MGKTASFGLDIELAPTKFRGLFVSIVALAVLVIWTAYGLAGLAVERNEAHNLKARLQHDALVLEDHASRTMDAVTAKMRSAVTLLKSQESSDRLPDAEALYGLIFDSPVLRSISLVNDQGTVVVSSAPHNLGAQLPRGIVPLDAASQVQEVIDFGTSMPFRDLHDLSEGRVQPEVSVWLAWTSLEWHGQKWWWVASVNPGFFQNFWTRLGDTAGIQITLTDYAGRPLVSNRLNNDPNDAMTQALSRVLADQLNKAHIGLVDLEPSRRWLTAYRGSTNHPFVFTLTADRQQMEALRASDDRLRLWLALLATVMVGAAVAWPFRWYLKYEASLAELANQARAMGAHVMVTECAPDGTLLRVNASLLAKTGYQENELLGQNPRVFSSGFHSSEFYRQLWQTINAGRIWQGLLRNRAKDGSIFWVNATIVPYKDPWGQIQRFVCLYSDITEAITLTEVLEDERRLRAEMARLNQNLQTAALTDALTGLANRRGLERFVQTALGSDALRGRPVSALMLDLDKFKPINDRHGHAAGDAVLTEVARRWAAQIRSSDLLARVGGEEFCVLLPNSRLNQAHEVAEKIRQATESTPFWVNGLAGKELIKVTVSIGLASSQESGCSSHEELLGCADRALYQSKQLGGNRISVDREGKAQ